MARCKPELVLLCNSNVEGLTLTNATRCVATLGKLLTPLIRSLKIDNTGSGV